MLNTLQKEDIALAGNIRTGSYEGQDGIRRYTTDVIIENFEFVGNNNANNQSCSAQDNSDEGFGDMTPVDDGDMPFWGENDNG